VQEVKSKLLRMVADGYKGGWWLVAIRVAGGCMVLTVAHGLTSRAEC
jgi:hypothetical protein